MLGILLIDKPAGITSHDVVARVRRALQTRRVGHAGTLDPMATGLLVVAVGPATRFLQYLPLEPKEYVCRFTFGTETDTYDSDGEIVAERPVPEGLAAHIEAGLPTFRGPIEQLPPMFSAVKRGGRALYEYARKGIEVERQPRRVFVEEFEALETGDGSARFRIVCSGGTYVRTLAHDLGQAIGCGAHVSELVRTRVGRFTLHRAIPLDGVTPAHLISLRDALPPMTIIGLNEAQVGHVREGRVITTRDRVTGRMAALADPSGRVISVARVDGAFLQPECVIPSETVHDPV